MFLHLSSIGRKVRCSWNQSGRQQCWIHTSMYVYNCSAWLHQPKMIDGSALDSFPGLFFVLRFMSSIYNAQKRKNIKKWGKAGLIHHASGGCRGERADVQICTNLAWKWVSYWSILVVVSTVLTSEVQNCCRPLEWMIQCIVLQLGSSPLRPPHIYLMSFTWWMSVGLPCFSLYFHKPKNKKQGRPGPGNETSFILAFVCRQKGEL